MNDYNAIMSSNSARLREQYKSKSKLRGEHVHEIWSLILRKITQIVATRWQKASRFWLGLRFTAYTQSWIKEGLLIL